MKPTCAFLRFALGARFFAEQFFGHVEGATGTSATGALAKKGKAKKDDDTLTPEQIEQVEKLVGEIQGKTAEYTLSQTVATTQSSVALYRAECEVTAAAIVRLDENGEPAPTGQAALNFPDFDPTFENLLSTGQIGPVIVKAVMARFHPTSGGSQEKTPATASPSDTISANTLKPEATPDASPTATATS